MLKMLPVEANFLTLIINHLYKKLKEHRNKHTKTSLSTLYKAKKKHPVISRGVFMSIVSYC